MEEAIRLLLGDKDIRILDLSLRLKEALKKIEELEKNNEDRQD